MKVQLPAEILQKFFGDSHHQLQIISTAASGSSGPRVMFLTNGDERTFALKYGVTRVPISRQVENRELLAAYIPSRLPKVFNYCTFGEGEAMLMEAIVGCNLHEAVVLGIVPDSEILRLLDSILDDFQAMWADSKRPAEQFTRDPRFRANKVRNAVESILAQKGVSGDDEIVINGRSVGRLNGIWQKMDEYVYPSFCVVCHSDLNGDNFLLDQRGEWYITDWEWVGLHDWQLSLSHLCGWWTSNASRLKFRPTLKRTGASQVAIEYGAYLPSICEEIQNRCMSAGESIASKLKDSRGWPHQFKILLGTLLLGEIRFLESRNRLEFFLPLIGEGMRAIYTS